MAAAKRKKDYSAYILPFLFCGLLIVLAVLKKGQAEPPAVEAVLQEGEPLTLTDLAIENYLYTDGFFLQDETVLDAEGQQAATLTVSKGEDGEIDAMTLSFLLPTYIETGNGSDVMADLKAAHDAAVSQGESVFLSLFDAVAATDGRIPARRERAVEKLRAAIDTGKSATQSANSWRFTFSLTPGELKSTVTILFTLVK